MATTVKKAVEEEKNEVVASKPNLLAGLKDLDDFKVEGGERKGLEEMDASDIKIPVYQLLQPMSSVVQDEKGGAGQFYNTHTGESKDSILATFLSLTKTRVRWPDEFSSGSKPLCRSFDGKHGMGNPGGNCKTCPLKEWGENNEAPECRQGYNWLALDMDNNGSVFRFQAISSGIVPTKKFLTEYMQEYGGYQLFVFNVKISSVKEKNNKGIFYVPKYEIIGVNDKAFAEKAKSAIETYADMLRSDLETEMDQGAPGTEVDEYNVVDDVTSSEADPF